MNKRTDDYYDEEAQVYSKKRYPGVATNYVQFLFMRRRELVLEMLGIVLQKTNEPRTLLEIGCADGVLLRSVAEKYPGAFERMLGTDISREMIDAAKQMTNDPRIAYAYRQDLEPRGTFACAMEIGVGALALETTDELARAAAHLVSKGYYICSFGSRDSWAARRGSTAAAREQMQTYAAYERVMRERFDIIAARSYGVYVPLLWYAPQLGRLLQPVAELLGTLLPHISHERLYLLEKK